MRRILGLILVLVLIAAGCGGDSDSDTTSSPEDGTTTTTTATTTTQPEATTTTSQATTTTSTTAPAAGPEARPATAVSAVMGADPAQGTYYTTGSFDAAVMGIEPESATAEWYRSEGFFLVFFTDVNTSETGPLCPGASAATQAGFEFVSNAPSAGADCSAFPTLVDDQSVRALECSGSIAYRTAIPDDTVGFLFGTLEKTVGDGIMGITSFIDSTTGEIPEVNADLFEC